MADNDEWVAQVEAPTTCGYCDGLGNSQAGGECGFCEKGKPLDTQADWDRTWGHAFKVGRNRGRR